MGELDHQRHDAFQRLLKAQLPNHEPADFLKKAQLLFGLLQSQFEIPGLRHNLIIDFRAPGGGESPTIKG
jgi:hypothetical protein